HIRKRTAFLLFGFYIVADQSRFFFAVPDAAHFYTLAVGAFGPERLSKPGLVRGDEAGSGAENGGRRAIIAFEADNPGARKILLEFEDVFDFRPAPAIDRLVVIAHAANILVLLGQQAEPQ